MNIKILVATHKKYWMPEDSIYLPLHVGREGKDDLGYVGDNTGDNISFKNANYCELTGLYWAWKNLDCEYIGLCHYRRYFATDGRFISWTTDEIDRILCGKDYEFLLRDCDILLPKKTVFEKQTLAEQYIYAHYEKDLIMTKEVLGELYPEYIDSFEYIMNQNKGYFANMFVTKKSILSKYCEWLFSILFEVEKRCDINTYDTYQARIFGFLSERLFSVWLNKNKLKINEIDIVMLEKKVKLKRRITRKLVKILGM